MLYRPSRQPVVRANTDRNMSVADVIGNKIDKAFSDMDVYPSMMGHLRASYYHVHNPSKCWPRFAAPVTVTASATAWADDGAIQEVIAAGAITNPFDIHWVIASNVSAQDDYTIEVMIGTAGAESLWGEIAFTRDSAQLSSASLPIQGIPIPANTRVGVRLRAGSNNARTCKIKLYTHEYPN